MKGMDSISYADAMRRRQEAGRYMGIGKAGMITLPSLTYSRELGQHPHVNRCPAGHLLQTLAFCLHLFA